MSKDKTQRIPMKPMEYNLNLQSDKGGHSVSFNPENPIPAREKLACMRVNYKCPSCKGMKGGCSNRPK